MYEILRAMSKHKQSGVCLLGNGWTAAHSASRCDAQDRFGARADVRWGQKPDKPHCEDMFSAYAPRERTCALQSASNVRCRQSSPLRGSKSREAGRRLRGRAAGWQGSTRSGHVFRHATHDQEQQGSSGRPALDAASHIDPAIT